ncbi:MAG: mechanosensitive ion channel family protein, partial [Betaproteobacteria bacterium]
MEIFGVNWVGLNAENGQKLAISLTFVVVLLLLARLMRALAGVVLGRGDYATTQTKFWTRQVISLIAAVVLIIGLLS